MAVVNLIDAASLPVGQSAEVVAEGRIFAVFNVEGHFYVIDGICPHAGGPLGKGMLRGDVVTCPWHGWQFNVATGQHCLNQRMCQTVFESRIVDGNVVIDLNT
jgi:nitrite reductase/ring-hydroxylating ferredoxin subunit